MKSAIATMTLFLAAGHAFGQWSDDFNRSALGASWLANGGALSNFSIAGNRGVHTIQSNDAMRYATASGAYQLSSQTMDLHVGAPGVKYVALGSGYGAGNNLYLKVQANGGSLFDKLGFYSGLNLWGYWAGSTPEFVDIAAPFADGTMQVYFTEGGDTANLVIDTNFDGIPDQHYTRNGARAFMTGSGTGFGIGGYGDASFDNWRIMPSILPASPSVGLLLAPFGASSTDTWHQVFRSGLWQTPVRITGVRYAAQGVGAWTGSLTIGMGYTSRAPGVAAPAGLDIPAMGGGGAPNVTGPLFPYYSNAAFSQTLVAGAAPLAEDFQLALNSTPGFVYFPGMGNLLMETYSVVGTTLDLGVSRAAGVTDSSAAYATTRFGNGTTVAMNTTPLVQFVAMPYTPDVLPTWANLFGNALPFAGGTAITHQAHHAGTLAPLGAGGSGKVAIQGLRYAPVLSTDTLVGQVTIRMGYTARAPGVIAPAGLDLPAAGGGGAPNASGPMRSFVDRMMNVGFSDAGPENFQLDLHQTPFVFDPTAGNLLIEAQTALASSVYVSRATGNPEATRTYRSSMYGDKSTPDTASRIKFVATPVSEKVYPAVPYNGGLNLPFYAGVNVMHHVLSAAQFGSDPVRIDSFAYAGFQAGVLTPEVTVRMGYTSRQPNVVPPAGLSPPDAGGDGVPNASFGPMAVFRSGPLPINVAAGDPNTYQIVIKGDAPFLYNPAMGNLLVEVVTSTGTTMPVYSWNSATSGSSVSGNTTAFGMGAYPNLTPLVRFTYFKDLYPCIADMTGDGTVDLNDFFAFFGCWDLSSPCADVDGAPGVDLNDFFAFLGSWDVGC